MLLENGPKMKLSPHSNLYLIGPMGAGKSSIGAQLAKRAGRPFYDSDREVESRSGVNISWIFEVEQEVGFRQREAQVIAELCQQSGIVLSTGGGAIVNPETRARLKNSGIVIYLKTSMTQQLTRASVRSKIRPLLQNNPEEALTKLNQQRQLFYEEIADLVYTTDHHNPASLAANIWKALND